MNFTQLLPLIIPVGIIELGLIIGAWIHIFTHDKYRYGNRWLWFVISLIQIVGPVLYFILGREEE